MSRMYDVANKANHTMWIIAESSEAALDIALSYKHIKSAKGATDVIDVTDDFVDQVDHSLEELLASGQYGPVALQVQTHKASEAMAALREGKVLPQKPARWVFIKS